MFLRKCSAPTLSIFFKERAKPADLSTEPFKEKETGPSTTIQFKETSQPIMALSVGVEDTLKIPETIFKQSFWKAAK